MKVYVVSCFYWHEGSINLAVYDSKEKAQTLGQIEYDKHVKEVTAVNCNMEIEEFELF